jgi:protein TonB
MKGKVVAICLLAVASLLVMGCGANKSEKTEIVMYQQTNQDADNSPAQASENVFVPYDEPPQIIGSVNPNYPARARQLGIDGTVVLEVEVYKDGSLGDILVKRSASKILDDEAIEAVSKVRFIPAKSSGHPVDTKLIMPIEFKLQSGRSGHQ